MTSQGGIGRLTAAAVATFAVGGALVAGAAPADAAVRTCVSSMAADQRPTVAAGDTGSCVTDAQRRLIAAGYSVGASGADGVFGSATVAAVKRFQAAKGLAVVGYIGPRTWSKLVPGTFISSGCGNTGNKVLLVFDDTSPVVTSFRNLIRTAKANGIGIGVAPNGSAVVAGRVDIGYARSNGMLVVDHTYDHLELTKLSWSQIVWEITRPYINSNYVRPPYGSQNATVRLALAQYGKHNCMWNLDPRDWDGKSTYAAADYIINNAFPGATAVVHLNHLGTQPATLAYIKAGLARRGLSLCKPWTGATTNTMPLSYCS